MKLFARVRDKLAANFLLCQRNTKNEYLLTGRIYCVCGRKRAGEGPQRGKHLYYRCLDRVLNFPLPRTCMEAAVNARVADRLVWNGIASLMTSPTLMQKQVQRWMSSQSDRTASADVDTALLKKEISKLHDQVDRYNKAYGSGVFTMDQLKEYTVPVREQLTLYESQLLKAGQEERESSSTSLPDESEIKVFAKEASQALRNLNFTAKKAIITNAVERVVGTREKLQVYGFIPVTTKSNVNVLPDDRHGRDTPRHGFNEENQRRIPFKFEIDTSLLKINYILN
jgi:site-specific DNA recombinase